MAKRMIWKTVNVGSSDLYRRIQGAWGSSQRAFGKNRIINFDGMTTIETNLPIKDLRALFRHAGVKINWSQEVLWDDKPVSDDDDFDMPPRRT